MKQETIAINNETALGLKSGTEKLVVAGSVGIVVVANALFLCLFLFWKHRYSPAVQLSVYLAAGLLHAAILRRSVPYASGWREWVYTIVATGLVLLFLGSSVFWESHPSLRLMIGCTSAFLLPFTLSEMWRAKWHLAIEGAKVWVPTTESQREYPSFYFNSLPVRFRILKGKNNASATIDFSVSKELSLGTIFYDLAQNKSRKTGRAVALADNDGHPVQWVFFTGDGWLLHRALDPSKTITENGLKQHAVIYAQPLTNTDFLTAD